ncbi:MAG: hypothetical protein KDN22_31185 [Verrucomicrobiae bacterium]|nr:hypothetical protein [Verrucomicrobiae bacterium]
MWLNADKDSIKAPVSNMIRDRSLIEQSDSHNYVPPKAPSSPSKMEEGEESDIRDGYVAIPTKALSMLRSVLLDQNSGQLDENAVEILSLTNREREAAQRVIDDTVSQIKQYEKDSTIVVTHENGNEFFEIKPYEEEGEKFRNALKERLERALGGKGVALYNNIRISGVFGGFGARGKQLYISEEEEDNGKLAYFLTENAIDSNGTISRGTRIRLNSGDEVKERYGHLFRAE